MEKRTISVQNIVYSSTVSSICVSLICTPLDVIKNYIQYNNNINFDKKYILKKITKKKKNTLLKFNSFYYQTFMNIYRNYGIRAVYRGLLSTANLYIINNTVFFYVYEELKEQGIPCYLSATISRFISIVITSPLEIYRTNVQANVCNNYKVSVFDIFKDKKNRKIKINLYKDIIKTNMQARCIDIIHKSDFDYKKIKNYDFSLRSRASNFYNICQNNLYSNKYIYDVKVNNYAHNNHRTIHYKYGSGKYGSNTYNYKYYNYFKLTNNYNYNVFSVAKIIFKRNGVKGFYVGIFPRLVKIVPTCAILFSTYHYFNY
ncbi:mitochondrial carrier protein [Plasmodium ovale wallikeri]|uniref:Mitochondrial carrier protein n=1 Tax=Plasmodium ovale wallikeri TaxID=864142 RepID=A0A1A8YK34_PLAOA|nr:mitochondrial carrier protein [Plasmodium ovale wallikeri]SBT31716.1 mitochondrial carrier protein [Plasmodium ovale wallikeri]